MTPETPSTLAWRLSKLEGGFDVMQAARDRDHETLVKHEERIDSVTEHTARLAKAVDRLTWALVAASLSVMSACVTAVLVTGALHG